MSEALTIWSLKSLSNDRLKSSLSASCVRTGLEHGTMYVSFFTVPRSLILFLFSSYLREGEE